jgi:hypothetical protein
MSSIDGHKNKRTIHNVNIYYLFSSIYSRLYQYIGLENPSDPIIPIKETIGRDQAQFQPWGGGSSQLA